MSYLAKLIEKSALVLDDDFIPKALEYKELLIKWNKTHNLTGVKDYNKLDEFIVDAIMPIDFLPPIKSILDIGSGAGFPAIPLAIALKDVEFTLVEPIKKRTSFLQFVKASLNLDNVTVVSARAEDVEPRASDLITSRAVSDTQMLLKLSKPFCSSDTVLLFYKGENVYDEVDENLQYEIIKRDNRHYLLIKAF